MTDIVERLLKRAKAARAEKTVTSDVDALHFEEAAAEIASLRAASEWRDISTAPILPLTDDLPCYYRFRCLLLKGRNVFEGYAEYTFKKKKLVWKNAVLFGRSCEPTHWQPLPAPPQRNEVTK